MKRHAATALLVASFLPLLPLARPAAAIEPLATPRALPPLPPLNPPAPAATAAPRLPAAAPAPVTAAATTNREIVLELRKRTISLMEGGKVLGKWPVAIGDPTTPTPTGRYSIRNKVVNPQYQSTKSGKNNPTIGPNGPLGDRWLGFHATDRDQFGIHGTPPAWAWAVHQGAAVTHGCVRMLGPHVRALFDQVDVGTPVTVKP